MKYGLLSHYYHPYNWHNTGDTIQSLAAAEYLPSIDAFLHYWNLRDWDEQGCFKVIMNGYWHPEFFFKKSFQMSKGIGRQKMTFISDNIMPFFISTHVATRGEHAPELYTDLKNMFTKCGTIYTRDAVSAEVLKQNAQKAEMSGCLTLTLKKSNVEKRDYIVVSDISDDLKAFLSKQTTRKIYDISSWISGDYGLIGELLFAENMLKFLQSAHCVISSRMHIALPCLALGTPTLLAFRHNIADFAHIEKLSQNDRFSGMSHLLYSSIESEYINNYDMFSVDNPPNNKDDYLPLREFMIKKCNDFIGSSPYYQEKTHIPICSKINKKHIKLDCIYEKAFCKLLDMSEYRGR